MPDPAVEPPFVSNPALAASGDDSVLPDLARGEGIEPPFISDDVRPCMATGCPWPGRFIFGIDGGTSTCWCIRHAQPEGVKWMIGFVDGVRGCPPPGWLDDA